MRISQHNCVMYDYVKIRSVAGHTEQETVINSFEADVQELRGNKYRFVIATIVILVRMMHGGIWASAGPMLPLIMQDFNISRSTVSWYASIVAIMMVLFTIPIGLVGVRMGTKRVFTLGALFPAACIAAFFISNFPALLVIRALFSIGIATKSGAPIPVYDEDGQRTGYKKDQQGKVVISQLDDYLLRNIAERTGGEYFKTTDTFDEIRRFNSALDTLKKREYETKRYTVYEERFQIPLALGILFLLIYASITVRMRRTSQ